MTGEIVLMKGFRREEAERALEKAQDQQKAKKILFVPLTEASLAWKTSHYLSALERGEALSEEKALSGERCALLWVDHDKRRAVTLMRVIKSVVPRGAEVICAMVTKHSLNWTIAYYLDHIAKEHNYMKDHDPASDPDMQPVKP